MDLNVNFAMPGQTQFSITKPEAEAANRDEEVQAQQSEPTAPAAKNQNLTSMEAIGSESSANVRMALESALSSQPALQTQSTSGSVANTTAREMSPAEVAAKDLLNAYKKGLDQAVSYMLLVSSQSPFVGKYDYVSKGLLALSKQDMALRPKF